MSLGSQAGEPVRRRLRQAKRRKRFSSGQVPKWLSSAIFVWEPLSERVPPEILRAVVHVGALWHRLQGPLPGLVAVSRGVPGAVGPGSWSPHVKA